jgi:hypothetical protein
MYLQVITTGIIVLGLVLTLYCVVRLRVSYRVVGHYLNEHTPDQQQEDTEAGEQ